MKGYGQYCPVAKTAEIIAERWTPLVLRELVFGSRHFNEIQRGVPLMSPSLLSQRLKRLEWAGIVERRPEPRGAAYELTAAGRELAPLIEMMGVWGQRWIRGQLHEDDLDPDLLMWDIHRRIDLAALPSRPILAQFEFAGVRRGRRRWWLLIRQDGVDLCLTDPGFEVDLFVATDVRTLTRVWLGDLPLGRTIDEGGIVLHGPADLRTAFPAALKLSTLATVEPAAASP